MSVKSAFTSSSFAKCIGYFAGFVMGRAFTSPEAARTCLRHAGAGNRAGFEASAPAAIGLGVKQGERLETRPLQVDASTLREAFNQGRASGMTAKSVAAAKPRRRPATTPRLAPA
ncbi:MAG: hypothetical protein H6865_01570 [Rhodospirillales bacterium]|nr:hypothetical protein [Alphaproteobacteria bacterium]MCB9986307.1 hypothetical protein [Rhodospirillales bacterium]USO07140.1 MAG: hypothetical protein H6866_06815 [Rhodospirillales bacterium]